MAKKYFLLVKPSDITRISMISGCDVTRNQRIRAQGLTLNPVTLSLPGNWDEDMSRTIKDSLAYRDYQEYIEKGTSSLSYDWGELINGIKENGYLQDPTSRYVEVAINQNGEILLVDGRHRLIVTQELGIKRIPVEVIYTHPRFILTNSRVFRDLVIPEVIYDQVIQEFEGEIYQKYSDIKDRLACLARNIRLFRGRRVLEVGVNAGMSIWTIMKVAEEYTGIEKDISFFEQAKVTQGYLAAMGTTRLFKASLREYFQSDAPRDFDSFFGSFILYHLDNEEIDLLRGEIFPCCDRVLFLTRSKERSGRRNKYYFNREENVRKLLATSGYRVISDNRGLFFATIGVRE